MRTFYFKARNIGQEKYLTYTMGEETELDEDVLDYCEENDVKELVDIIYEEDDDYDYLTYDITDKVSLTELMSKEVSSAQALFIVRNVAVNLISVKEQAIHLSYILLNREYVYVGENNNIFFICVPVENKGSLSVEFKGFLRQILANMKYNVDEDLNFVGKLLTYINSDNFNLRGLVGLAEALMEEAGIEYDEAGTIETDGVEVVNTEPEDDVSETEPVEKTNVTDFMNDADDIPLPEINLDEEEPEEEEIDSDEELDSILPTGMKPIAEETESESQNDIENIDDLQTVNIQTVKIEDMDDVQTVKIEDADEIKTVKLEPEELGTIPEINIDPIPETTPVAEPIDLSIKTPEPVAAPEPKLEPISEPVVERPRPVTKKVEDLDAIKSKIQELVGGVPVAKTTVDDSKKIKTLADLEEMLEENKAPVPKKNVVKVNRAAIIQSIAEQEAETEELSEEEPDKKADKKAEKKADKKAEAAKEEVEEAAEVKEPEPVKINTLLNAPKAMPYLIRVNTEERIMLNKQVFKIGKASRGVDYSVSGNGAISRQHAVITQKDGVCYIKDNKSTNHTYINDKEVEEGKEEILTHDSIIKLGDEEFLFKIR